MKIWRRGDNEQSLTLADFGEVKDDYPPEILLYELSELGKFQQMTRLAKDSQESASYVRVQDALTSRPQNRQLLTMRINFRAGLDALLQKFPNFAEVIDYIRCCAEVAWRTDKVLRFTPILLCGEGGVGKTLFCESLGKWMAQGFHRISVSSSQNGSDLAGSSAFWSNAKPGVPFNAMVYGDYANPLIFLDEIDKSSTTQYDALGALYVLLEKSTARTFTDQCYPIPIRCDEIQYIACCNEPDNIPPALRTRFREFTVRITPEQSRKVAEAIVRSTIKDLSPAADNIEFTDTAMEALARMTPRRISQAVTEAIGRAFANDASTIERIDHQVPTKRGIGFTQ